MNKQQFKKAVKELLSIRKDEDNLNEAFRKFDPDFNCISLGRYETLFVNTLEIAMNDKYEYISYFLYDMYGKFTERNLITDKDSKDITPKNVGELYDLIKNEEL